MLREILFCALISFILPTVRTMIISHMEEFSRQGLKATISFLTVDQMRRLTLQVNASRQRVVHANSPNTLLSSASAPQQTDIIFRAMLGINSTGDVLVEEKTQPLY